MISAERKQLRHIFTVTSGATPESGNPEYWDGDIPWVTPEDVSSAEGYWIRDTRRKITAAGYESCGTKMAEAEAIVLTKRAPIGQLAVLARPACSNQGCLLLSAHGEADSRFYYYYLSTQTAYLQALGRGSTFMELSTDDLKALPVPHPPLQHQQAIADYLDRETGRLDALIKAKEGLLELISEKRRAIIAWAVTCGLVPGAASRASEVPWLERMPAAWSSRRLRFACESIQTGGTPSAEFLDDTSDDVIEWFTPGDFSDQLELRESARKVSAAAITSGELKVFPAGSVLVVGIGATLGKVGVLAVEASANQQINALVPRPDVDARFLAYQLAVLAPLLNASANTATLPILNQQRLGDVAILVPPLGEQHAIVEHIDREAARLDKVHTATENTITLLKKRRGALIAAAVTGQLEVT